MSVSASMLGTIWRVLQEYGFDPADVIAERHYRPHQQASAPSRLGFGEYDAIVTRAADLVSDPAFGLRTASCWHPSHAGALGGCLLASPTLRVAFQCSARYLKIIHDHYLLDIKEQPDRLSARYGVLEESRRPNLMGDARVAILFRMCEINLGRLPVPVDVSLTRQQPDNPQPWNDFFGVPVRFGQPFNGLAISRSDADEPLTGGDWTLIGLHQETMKLQLARMDEDNIVYRAQLILMEQLPAGRITGEGLARQLNVSNRTLQRKLRENGESFRSLLKRIRIELAKRFLADSSYNITDIAFLLGYADASAFSRAYKAWFGVSPQRARNPHG